MYREICENWGVPPPKYKTHLSALVQHIKRFSVGAVVTMHVATSKLIAL